MGYQVEVLPYHQATWAPKTPGLRFRMAWRIMNNDGDTRASGVSNAPEQDVRKLAESAAKRLQSYSTEFDFATIVPSAPRRGGRSPSGHAASNTETGTKNGAA